MLSVGLVALVLSNSKQAHSANGIKPFSVSRFSHCSTCVSSKIMWLRCWLLVMVLVISSNDFSYKSISKMKFGHEELSVEMLLKPSCILILLVLFFDKNSKKEDRWLTICWLGFLMVLKVVKSYLIYTVLFFPHTGGASISRGRFILSKTSI